jgi:hypothetical protein
MTAFPHPSSSINHPRAGAPVGHRPQCGGGVNGAVTTDAR